MSTANYSKSMLRLESQFAGSTDPATMGTTGLIAWVCVAGGMRLYTRFRTARAIIRKRLGESALPGFVRACIAAAPCQWRKENIARYAKAK